MAAHVSLELRCLVALEDSVTVLALETPQSLRVLDLFNHRLKHISRALVLRRHDDLGVLEYIHHSSSNFSPVEVQQDTEYQNEIVLEL